MKTGSFKFIMASLLAASMFACDDTASSVGSSLTGSNVEIAIDSTFTISGKTIRVANIRPKTVSQILGNISIENYGTLSSDVVAQFLPSTELDTANFSYQNVDSIFLTLRYALGDYIGDSIAPIGLTVYPLDKLLPDTISSGFKPTGYYKSSPLATTTYNTLPESNPLNSSASYREILVKLPTDFGRQLYKDFQDNPSNFVNGDVFARNVFPGIYMRTSFGSGRMTVISSTSLTFYLRNIREINEEKNDTTDAVHQYMLVTPEVISNNNLHYSMAPKLEQLLQEGKHLLVAPAACEMEITLPTKKLVEQFKAQGNLAVLNSLTMKIPVDSIENNGNVAPPPYVLLVLKKDREEFFAKNKLPDNITSFYATYDSANKCYSFATMRPYLLEMLDCKEVKEEDYVFSLVPVQVSFEQVTNTGYSSIQYTEADVQPYLLSPAMGAIDLSKTQIKLTFSRLTQN